MSEKIKGLLFYQAPPWLWGLGIFIGSSVPTRYLPEFVLINPDKLLHIGVFFMFTILVYRGVSYKKTRSAVYLVVVTALISIGYGIFDEIHQYLTPGRSADAFDVIADTVGVLIGLMTMKIYNIIVTRKDRHMPVKDEHLPVS